MKRIIIAAVAKNYVIGRSSGIEPWHSEEDLKHFKDTTIGYPVIMGRKTFEVLQRPLELRLNIVISKESKLKNKFKEIEVFSSLQRAYEFCGSKNYEKIFIIGGGKIFNEAISQADEMIISYMDFEVEGNIYFPKIDLSNWTIIRREQKKGFEIVYFTRKN